MLVVKERGPVDENCNDAVQNVKDNLGDLFRIMMLCVLQYRE